jgi:hypothetical protein
VRRGKAPVVLVVGPPCSGKTELVQKHMEPGDLVVDHDKIARALGSPTDHDHPESLRPYILQATWAVLERSTRDPDLRCVWYIRCEPNQADLDMASEILVSPTPIDVCLQRARQQGRPPRVLEAIEAWQEPDL